MGTIDPSKLSRIEQDKYDLIYLLAFGRISKEEFQKRMDALNEKNPD